MNNVNIKFLLEQEELRESAVVEIGKAIDELDRQGVVAILRHIVKRLENSSAWRGHTVEEKIAVTNNPEVLLKKESQRGVIEVHSFGVSEVPAKVAKKAPAKKKPKNGLRKLVAQWKPKQGSTGDRILKSLWIKDCTQKELVQKTKRSQGAISIALKLLVENGLVTPIGDGFYSFVKQPR